MIRWSFLILDLDRIYDLERKDENGIEPEVFLIQDDDLLLAKQCVNDLSDVFLMIIDWMIGHLVRFLLICYVRKK